MVVITIVVMFLSLFVKYLHVLASSDLHVFACSKEYLKCQDSFSKLTERTLGFMAALS